MSVFEAAGESESLWVRIVTKCKRFWVESLQCRMVRVRLSQCLGGGGGELMIKAPAMKWF
jgi:hypothetical protein